MTVMPKNVGSYYHFPGNREGFSKPKGITNKWAKMAHLSTLIYSLYSRFISEFSVTVMPKNVGSYYHFPGNRVRFFQAQGNNKQVGQDGSPEYQTSDPKVRPFFTSGL